MTFRPRRAVAALATLALTGSLVGAFPQSALAIPDDSTHLTIVGTSDVEDSGLMTNYLLPKFKAATGISATYVSKGTGAAIDYAKAGTASALIVHAASLENQFVADGYSLEPYGRSVFWGDYVLAGPKNSDPAGVLNTPHDIVSAYENIAAAGAQGKADFVSRGGTPGTTVQEHALWALTGAGVTKCDVSATNGGGQAPSTASGACPATPTPPAWYHQTGLTQGPNITNADTCNYNNGQDCYVMTDRGTFQYLQSTGQAQNLRIMVRNNAATARGSQTALINAFHAYAINPAGVTSHGGSASNINTTAATAFLNWLTSPEGQSAVGAYLSADSPFIPASAPQVTLSALPTQVVGSRTLTFTGRVANAVPGYPSLSGVPIQLKAAPDALPGSTAATIASTTTDANGNFSMSYKPTYGATYSLAVPQIQKIENASLTPAFGDIEVATTRNLGHVGVLGSFSSRAKRVGRTLRVHGVLKPKVFGKKGKILLYRAKPGHKLRYAGQKRLKKGATSYAVSFRFPKGKWKWEVVYVNDGRITRRHSPVHVVRVP